MQNSDQQFTPSQTTAKRTRLVWLDALRGIAVLGILYLNMAFFINFEFGYVSPHPEKFGESLLSSINQLFMEGRFRSLFIMLFGIGLYLQLNKSNKEGDSAQKTLRVRLKILLWFGVFHGACLWAGDILLSYAAAGLVIINSINLPVKEQLKKGIKYCVLGTGVMLAILMLEPLYVVNFNSVEYQEYLADFSHTFFATRAQNFFYFLLMLFMLAISFLWYTAGMCLLAIAAYRQNIFTKKLTIKQRGLLWSGTAFLSAFSWLFAESSQPLLFSLAEVVNWWAAFFMAVIIARLVVKLANKQQLIWRLFTHVGRLSLSVYISQTVFMLIVAHYFGEYIVRHFTLSDYFLLATGFNLFTLIVASVYRQFFHQGPLEWLWHKMVTSQLIK